MLQVYDMFYSREDVLAKIRKTEKEWSYGSIRNKKIRKLVYMVLISYASFMLDSECYLFVFFELYGIL